mmetsp:Transcript_44482/g.117528  ORF Transcript_44482/g.117528 Transcript_44482/m.117528 type:complete len:96 (-) Transcript_44482:127-414(-)
MAAAWAAMQVPYSTRFTNSISWLEGSAIDACVFMCFSTFQTCWNLQNRFRWPQMPPVYVCLFDCYLRCPVQSCTLPAIAAANFVRFRCNILCYSA